MTHKLDTVPSPKTKDMNTKNPKYPPKKSTPTGVTYTKPQKNFVEACYANKGDMSGFDDYMYGPRGTWDARGNYIPPKSEHKKASGFGHGVGQRAGKLRTSGNPRAHRIGKR